MPSADRPSPWRRLAAYAIDSLVILAYIIALTAVSLWVQSLLGVSMNQLKSPLSLQLIGFTTLTLPVILYFAIMQAGARGATLGKQTLGLRVQTPSGGPARLPQTLLRAAIKFLPWEIAHAGIWWASTGAAPAESWPTLLFSLSLGMALSYVVALFIASGRAPYDAISGLRVAHARDLSSRR